MGVLQGKYAEGTNDLKTKDLFQERKFFAEDVISTAPEIPTLNLHEKRHYGKANHYHHAVFPSEANLSQFTTPEDVIFALDFVVDAFNDMRNHFLALVQQGDIASENESTFFGTDLIPKKGWESMHKNYHSHVRYIYNNFLVHVETSRKRQEEMQNFSSFVKMARPYLLDVAHAYPMTRTGYVYSNHCPLAISGLVIELYKFDHSIDRTKEMMLEDINYKAYAYLANKYGFYIDKNAPWRLIAKIGSSKLEKYMNPYGISSLYQRKDKKLKETIPKAPNYLYGEGEDLYEIMNDLQMQLSGDPSAQAPQIMEDIEYQNVFEGYYYKAHEDDPDSLKNYLMHWYNSYVSQNQYITKTSFCENAQETRVVHKIRKPVEKSEVDKVLNSRDLLNMYFQLRAVETETKMTVRKSKSVFKRIESILNYKGYDAALSYINQLFCGTYISKYNKKTSHGTGYKYNTTSNDIAVNQSVSYDTKKKKSAHQHFGTTYNKKNIKDSY